jgi:AraC-like DNA-binding protein
MRKVREGAIGIVLPGDSFDTLYTSGALYITASFDLERLERMINQKIMRSAVHPLSLNRRQFDELKTAVFQIHADNKAPATADLAGLMITASVSHYKNSIGTTSALSLTGHESIVHRGRQYIEQNLAKPILIDELTAACGTSKRTLYRAFLTILGETPIHFIRRLRLHRIRNELTDGNPSATISTSARKWGIREHGRMSGWYQDVFGEKPSATVAARDQRQLSGIWL